MTAIRGLAIPSPLSTAGNSFIDPKTFSTPCVVPENCRAPSKAGAQLRRVNQAHAFAGAPRDLPNRRWNDETTSFCLPRRARNEKRPGFLAKPGACPFWPRWHSSALAAAFLAGAFFALGLSLARPAEPPV